MIRILADVPAGSLPLDPLAAFRKIDRVSLNVTLQWFAPEDEGKTEEPSEYKIRKAREEGRVPKSQDLSSAIGLLLTTATLGIFAPSMLETIRGMLRWYLTISVQLDITKDAGPIMSSFMSYFSRLLMPVMVVAFVSALGSNLLQVGFIFTTKPIQPDFKKIVPNFPQYFKRTMFSMDGLYNILKSLLKIVIIGVVVYLNISAEMPRLTRLFTATVWVSSNFVSGIALRIVLETAVIMLAMAIPDYVIQRRQHRKQLMMTKQEVKEEHKMMEGDPLIKSRIRERMREILTKNMAANVPKADVVITNPTHFAIALEWNREAMTAPTVTAKGMDEVAMRIKAIAKESRVPIVENKPLARALYAETEIGDTIPEKYYEAIATVLAHVAKTDARAKARYAQTAGRVPAGRESSGI